jgi:hypothetical protein
MDQVDAGEVAHPSVRMRCSLVVLCCPPCYEDVTVGKLAMTTAKEIPGRSPYGLFYLLCSGIPQASGVERTGSIGQFIVFRSREVQHLAIWQERSVYREDL